MARSDDEIYKKAYEAELERIRVEKIKAKAADDARLASKGLTKNHKNSALGRWAQKKRLRLQGGQEKYQDLTRSDLQKQISDLKKIINNRGLDKRSEETKKHWNGMFLYQVPIGDKLNQILENKIQELCRVKMKSSLSSSQKSELRRLELGRWRHLNPEVAELSDLQKELDLRIRLNTY